MLTSIFAVEKSVEKERSLSLRRLGEVAPVGEKDAAREKSALWSNEEAAPSAETESKKPKRTSISLHRLERNLGRRKTRQVNFPHSQRAARVSGRSQCNPVHKIRKVTVSLV